ncbi:MAG: F0F1 ATP synthase subunit A [Chloroflexota bacterium]|jgi:F-type H+-transporting ATPase subunit a|nr:F0F1 ATP synthase subunit A [Chloroflexota bacterium]
MRGRLLVLGAIALAGVGFIFLRGPSPHIQIRPEVLADFGLVKITNTMVTSWVVVLLMVGTVFLLTRRWELVPRGAQNFIEAVIEAFYNLVTGVAGEKNGRRFFPVVATIFFFILFANWFALTPLFNVVGLVKQVPPEAVAEHPEGKVFVMDKVDVGPLPVGLVPFPGLGQWQGEAIELGEPGAQEEVRHAEEEGKLVGEFLPFLRSMNTDVNMPLALALAATIAVEYWGITALGLGTYAGKFFNFGRLVRGIVSFRPSLVFEGVIDAFVGVLELFSEIIRIISFTFRLFGNMFAGEVVILMFTFLTPLLLTLPFYGLELFVGVIQAFIFAILTLVFGMAAVSHGAHEAGEHAAGHAGHVEEATAVAGHTSS